MSPTTSPNYPDILGAITGGPRYSVQVVQLALAVRPRIIYAGRPFEAILLVQNASDAEVDVTVNLNLPDRDAKKQKDQFGSQHPRLVVGLRPAEVGYVTLPVTCATTTTPHNNYKLGTKVQVKPLGKPQRIRQPEGGPGGKLNEHAQAEVDDLRKLNFSAEKHFGLGDTLETTFEVLPGRLGSIANTRPGWISLWTMADHVDDTVLLATFAPLLLEHVLPVLKPENTLDTLQETMQARFEQAGYPLHSLEALFIARMLARVLQLAHPVDDLDDFEADHVYNVLYTLQQWMKAGGSAAPVRLPHWCQGMLRAIGRNKDAAQHPITAISQLLYDDLIRDAVPLAIALIEQETGEELGTPEEAQAYADQLVSRLQSGTGVNFDDAYMPLILGGLLVGDRVRLDRDYLDVAVRDLFFVLQARRAEQNEYNAFTFELATRLIDRFTQAFDMP